MLDTFEKCIRPTLKEEAGYSNLPTDNGGETYRGISRKFQPTWEGWPIIDRCKENGELARYWINGELDALTWPFYQIEFWDRYELLKYPAALRYCLFDSFVMSGQNTFGIIRQAANIGAWDKTRAGAIEAAAKITLEALILARLDYFLYLARLNANYAISLKGWTNRLARVFERAGGQDKTVISTLQTQGF